MITEGKAPNITRDVTIVIPAYRGYMDERFLKKLRGIVKTVND